MVTPPRRYPLVLRQRARHRLAAATYSDVGGEIVISCGYPGSSERRAFMACVVIPTAGEMLLSLGWGRYTYRLGVASAFYQAPVTAIRKGENHPDFAPALHSWTWLYPTAPSRSRPVSQVSALARRSCHVRFSIEHPHA